MNSTPDESVERPDEDAPDTKPVEVDTAPANGESASAEAEAAPAQPADERLLAAHDQARAALIEITPEATIGDPAGYSLEADGVVSLRFENRLSGYPGWYWTVSLARLEDADPTVLEVELLPGGDALLAPDWVPWAVRLADYQAAQEAIAEANAAAGILDDDDAEELDADELDDELDAEELDDLDAADFDSDGSPILHAGDVDGVDIDELDDSVDDADDESDDDADDDSDDDDDADFADAYDEGSREY